MIERTAIVVLAQEGPVEVCGGGEGLATDRLRDLVPGHTGNGSPAPSSGYSTAMIRVARTAIVAFLPPGSCAARRPGSAAR